MKDEFACRRTGLQFLRQRSQLEILSHCKLYQITEAATESIKPPYDKRAALSQGFQGHQKDVVFALVRAFSK
jgi:hypothetical protein